MASRLTSSRPRRDARALDDTDIAPIDPDEQDSIGMDAFGEAGFDPDLLIRHLHYAGIAASMAD